jgi:hypothetical protein
MRGWNPHCTTAAIHGGRPVSCPALFAPAPAALGAAASVLDPRRRRLRTLCPACASRNVTSATPRCTTPRLIHLSCLLFTTYLVSLIVRSLWYCLFFVALSLVRSFQRDEITTGAMSNQCLALDVTNDGEVTRVLQES